MSLEVGTVGGSWEKKTPEGAASREVALVTARAAGGGVQLRYNPRLPRTFQKEAEESGLKHLSLGRPCGLLVNSVSYGSDRAELRSCFITNQLCGFGQVPHHL